MPTAPDSPSANLIAQALRARSGAEMTDLKALPNQLRFQFRVPANGTPQWLLLLHHMLVVSESSQWKADFSRKYILRMSGGAPRMVYAWRLIFECTGIAAQVNSILSAIQGAPHPQRTELQEFPLAGAQRNFKNGKGAYSAETAPMAASVVAAQRMGGSR